MRKLFSVFLVFILLTLSACVWTTTALDPIPDIPVKPDPVPEQIPPAEEVPEEIPEETPPEQTETPTEPDLSAIQAQVEAFLKTPGVNGLICGGGNWPEEPVRLNEVVYQLTDESIDYDDVVAAYAADGGEVFTDLSYITSTKLDELLLSITGYSLYENGVISSCWNLQDMLYFPDLDLYCIQHGDTNYQPFRAQVMDFDEETHLAYVRLNGSMEDMSLFCYIADSFTPCRYFDLVLAHTGEKEFVILSIQPYVK